MNADEIIRANRALAVLRAIRQRFESSQALGRNSWRATLSLHGLSEVRDLEPLARGIAARSGETHLAARPEGQEPDPTDGRDAPLPSGSPGSGGEQT